MDSERLHDNISDLESQIDELKKTRAMLARRVQMRAKAESSSAAARKARTRRLIQLGALAEKYLGAQGITPEEFEPLLMKIARIEDVKKILPESETDAETGGADWNGARGNTGDK
jgi:predicted RNase H-like nuclease (RuvC/YqgF family)